MTASMIVTLIVLALSLILFASGRVRMDVVAVLILCALVVSGTITAEEGLAGFSNPAVITVWAVFIISGGLTRTGVANLLGQQLQRLTGKSETRQIGMLMLLAALMSSVMNNIGVVAMFLPVVMDVARRSHKSPARYLLPLVQATLLGATLTVIGNPANILTNSMLVEAGLQPFKIFDFTPLGLPLTLIGILFILVITRRMLPKVDIRESLRRPEGRDLPQIYDLNERFLVLNVPADSPLHGKTLGQCRLGTALGLNVVAVLRGDQKFLSPDAAMILFGGDRLWVVGRLEHLEELAGWQRLLLENGSISAAHLVSDQIDIVEMRLSARSQYIGKTIENMNFRNKMGVNVLAIMRDGTPRRTNFIHIPLQPEDILLIQATRPHIENLRQMADFVVLGPRKPGTYRLAERLLEIRVPEGSDLSSKTLEGSRLGAAFGLNVVGIFRGAETHLLPAADERLLAGDTLIVEGRKEDVDVLRGLQTLQVEKGPAADFQWLESDDYGLVEVMLHPRANLAGRTLRDLHFREKYGLNVLAIWSDGRAYRSDLFNHELRFGDALLVYGRRERLAVLAQSRDFMILTQESQPPPVYRKAALSAAIMAGIFLSVILGWLPISFATVLGAILMVVGGCISMNDAYSFIEWRVVFMIAGMLSLGVAMEKSGLALLLSQAVVSLSGGYGSTALMAGFYIVANLASQVMPNAAVVVIMTPLAMQAAQQLGLSAYGFAMAVAIATNACFLLPISHPANLLIMGPGGYRARDYVRTGLPLTLIVLLITLILVPILWR